jgi:hypothetical protein
LKPKTENQKWTLLSVTLLTFCSFNSWPSWLNVSRPEVSFFRYDTLSSALCDSTMPIKGKPGGGKRKTGKRPQSMYVRYAELRSTIDE